MVMKNWVTVKRENVDSALSWAKKHCPTYITNDYSRVGGRIDPMERGNDYHNVDFFFVPCNQGEKDMILFALKWI
jgi:hypothetical protein